MTQHRTLLALAAASLALGACATTGSSRGAPAEVSRFHLGQPIAPGTILVEPMENGPAAGPEFAIYRDAVSAELARLGFTPAGSGSSQYIAVVGFAMQSRGSVRTPPRFSIGLGGGGFSGGRRGGGVGLGGGVSTGFGSKTRELYESQLSVAIRRRSDGTIVWEGRAQQPGMSGRDDSQPGALATRLASALFRGFPGESGITTTVR